MLLDNLSAPILTLLLSLSFIIAILFIYEKYNNMQVLAKEPSILLPTPPSLDTKDQIDDTATTADAADIGVLSYLLYRAMGNNESKATPDQRLPIATPSAPRSPSQTGSPNKRGSRGGRAKGKHARQAQPKEAQTKSMPSPSPARPPRAKQPYDTFLVFDVEATCVQGQDFNWCNEIIVSRSLHFAYQWPYPFFRSSPLFYFAGATRHLTEKQGIWSK